MAPPSNGEISFSFACLQRVMQSFQELERGQVLEPNDKEVIWQLVEHLGEVAIPVLLRNLFAEVPAAEWASVLLQRLGSGGKIQARILRELRDLEYSPSLSPSSQFRVAELIATLGGWQSELPAMLDIGGLPEQSLNDLTQAMHSHADVAYVADTLLQELPPAELRDCIEDLIPQNPGAAKALLQELILRDDVPLSDRQEFRSLASGMTDVLNEVELPFPLHPRLLLGTHPSGRSALLCYVPIEPSEYPQLRALQLQMGDRNSLSDAKYWPRLDHDQYTDTLVPELVEAGYELSPISLQEAQKRLILAMRVRFQQGLAMPRDYYLGRDILGLRDEHLTKKSHLQCDEAALLARGTDLLRRGHHKQACELLLQYAKLRPADSEAMASLGACLVASGRLEQARVYLERASDFSPDVARYHWNLASLSHREGRLADCYISFQGFLRCEDAAEPEQRDLAEVFVRNYRRKASLHDNGAQPTLKEVQTTPKGH